MASEAKKSERPATRRQTSQAQALYGASPGSFGPLATPARTPSDSLDETGAPQGSTPAPTSADPPDDPPVLNLNPPDPPDPVQAGSLTGVDTTAGTTPITIDITNESPVVLILIIMSCRHLTLLPVLNTVLQLLKPLILWVVLKM